jgi:hypothetical protein
LPLFPEQIFLLKRITPLLLGALVLGLAHGESLYETDFDDFPTGDNAWAGFDGWLSSDTTSGVQAIDEGLFDGALGKTAALGFNRPNGAFTTIARTIGYDPAVGGNPLIEVQSLFGIEDSTVLTNYRRDDFFYSFYNLGGALLAALRISNTETEYGFWRRDGDLQAGGTETDTGEDFVRGELHNLNALIDLANNTWTVLIDGIPIFENVTFNGTSQSRTLGPVAMEWQVAAGNRLAYGDNWMLVADLSIETIEEFPPPLIIDSIVRNPPGSITLSWEATPGFDYLVEYSPDQQNWFDDLPNSSKTAPPVPKIFEFTDGTPKSAPRYYRIRRVPVGGGLPTNVLHTMRDSSGEATITWTAHGGFSYQVEFSDDHETWSSSLPGSSFSTITSDGLLEFTDPAASSLATRFYRLVRTGS